MKKFLLAPENKTRSKVERGSVSLPGDIWRWARKEAPRRGFRSTSSFIADILQRAQAEAA